MTLTFDISASRARQSIECGSVRRAGHYSPVLNGATGGSIVARSADGVAGVGVGDVVGDGGVELVADSVASSLASPFSSLKLGLVVFSLTMVTSRRGGTALFDISI